MEEKTWKKKETEKKKMCEWKKKKGGERTIVKESKADKLRKTHNGIQLILLVIHVHLNVEIRKKKSVNFSSPLSHFLLMKKNVSVIQHKKAWCFTNHFYDLYTLFQRDEIKESDKRIEQMSKEI